MARQTKVEENASARLEKFKETATAKMERAFGPLFTAQLEKLTDAQWQTVAKKARYKARDAALVLTLEGLASITA